MREIKPRFGAFRLCFAWALTEPLAHVVMLSIVFSIRSRTTPQGAKFPISLATGIIPFLFFLEMVSRGMTTVTANQALFASRQVRPFDTLVARFGLEVVIYLAVFLVFMAAAGWAPSPWVAKTRAPCRRGNTYWPHESNK